MVQNQVNQGIDGSKKPDYSGSLACEMRVEFTNRFDIAKLLRGKTNRDNEEKNYCI
jgi:hypothetical protein